MDEYEQMSWDLEAAQTKRHAKAKNKEAFWTQIETFIFEEIKSLRKKSKTYHPDNKR